MWNSNINTEQAIFALASGALPSAIAIVRLSGKTSFQIARRLFKPKGHETLPEKRGFYFGTLKDSNNKKIDECVVIAFRAPNGFSGEHTIEFQCHGSVPIVSQLTRSLRELGARPAEKGEFSYRAFLNGKLSLSELEDLRDVYRAADPHELFAIYQRRDGTMLSQISRLREQIIHLQAILDTAIDFSDEYSSVLAEANTPLKAAIRECSLITQRYSSFAQAGNLPRIVLCGQTNAGKSSLFNALLCRYRAIVDSKPGTTRDVLEEEVEIESQRFRLVDTAGLRPEVQGPEKQGIELGQEYLSAARLWILVIDGTRGLSDSDRQMLERFGGKAHFVVWNKVDLEAWERPIEAFTREHEVFALSAKTGESLEKLWKSIQASVRASQKNHSVLPSESQAGKLALVLEALRNLREDLKKELPPEHLAETNRRILSHLGGVMDPVDTEQVLGKIFSSFCIGK